MRVRPPAAWGPRVRKLRRISTNREGKESYGISVPADIVRWCIEAEIEWFEFDLTDDGILMRPLAAGPERLDEEPPDVLWLRK